MPQQAHRAGKIYLLPSIREAYVWITVQVEALWTKADRPALSLGPATVEFSTASRDMCYYIEGWQRAVWMEGESGL